MLQWPETECGHRNMRNVLSIVREKLSGAFGHAAQEPAIPATPFTGCLRGEHFLRYDDATVRNILGVFGKLGLPPPVSSAEFMKGSEGQLVFLSRYGLVLRIEEKRYATPAQVKGAPWVLQPLKSIDAGMAVVAVCPACHVGGSMAQLVFLKERLRAQDVNFSDFQFVNFGRLPVKMPLFPEGVPVVIDRGAVSELTERVSVLGRALEKEDPARESAFALEARAAAETLYRPLRQALDDAWPDASGPADPAKMQQFFKLCAVYKEEGKLVAGWDDPAAIDKTKDAARMAGAYETRLAATERLRPAPGEKAPAP